MQINPSMHHVMQSHVSIHIAAAVWLKAKPNAIMFVVIRSDITLGAFCYQVLKQRTYITKYRIHSSV